jgi:transcriptional regulator with XRE-family HTH domain
MLIPYKQFGELVADRRVKAGIATQDALAKLLDVRQQTVSRWEAGQSRPRVNQMAELAQALKTSPNELLEAAGYTTKKSNISFDVPFPVDSLPPESFERFTADLIQALHPAARVCRFGGQGHDQAGIDVLADLPRGERHTFQCKRVAEFGPQKVRDVVTKQTFPADRNYLLITRTASPDARAAIDPHKEWELWDRDDISRKVRQLPVDDQKRLVRIYFPGQELALLGVSPHSPWETIEEFYAVYTREQAPFNHTWQLVGREGVLEKTFDALRNPKVGAILIIGSGGGGKSRILKEVLERFEAEQPARKIRLASPTMEITKASLDELGGSDSLLVIDDAHDRDDLQVLFSHAATVGPRVSFFSRRGATASTTSRRRPAAIRFQATAWLISTCHLSH